MSFLPILRAKQGLRALIGVAATAMALGVFASIPGASFGAGSFPVAEAINPDQYCYVEPQPVLVRMGRDSLNRPTPIYVWRIVRHCPSFAPREVYRERAERTLNDTLNEIQSGRR